MTGVVEAAPGGREHTPVRGSRLFSLAGNVVGAVGAAFFLRATVHTFTRSHELIGGALIAQETWVVVAYLVRRSAQTVSRRPTDWLLAFGGTFGGVLLRPSGAHVALGIGLVVQLTGLVLCVVALLALGRSFGFAAADRGLARRGPYAAVRHPVYASYLIVQCGYLLQSASLANLAVVALVTACNGGRAAAEERVLTAAEAYREYATHVRWRVMPGVW